MPYNSKNKEKSIRSAIAIYNEHKHSDVPDTHIVRVIFPKHKIFISYRTWMEWKGRVFKTPEPQQLALF